MELIVVMALLGIALAMAAPSFWGYIDTIKLRSATREIVADIFLVRQRAISENRPYRIVFDQGDNSYSMSKRKEDDSDWDDAYQKRSLSSFGKDISFDFKAKKTVYFQTRGTASANTIIVNNKNTEANITINFAGRTYVSFFPK